MGLAYSSSSVSLKCNTVRIGASLIMWSFLCGFVALGVLSQSVAPFFLLLYLGFILVCGVVTYRQLVSRCIPILFLCVVCWTVVLNTFSFSHQVSPLGGDAMLFYQLSTDAFVSSLPMESLLRGIINAPLAVKVWGGWYELNAQLGLEKKPWIGLQLNVLAVLLCFVLLGRSISAIDCFHNRAVSWGQTLFVASGITFL